jgi:hypothetical protein
VARRIRGFGRRDPERQLARLVDLLGRIAVDRGDVAIWTTPPVVRTLAAEPLQPA